MRWLKTRASFVFIEGETLSYRHGIVAFNEQWNVNSLVPEFQWQVHD